ncbi:MAG: hypothetical protein CMP95_08560 [Gammaproteobacteria bacterium]|nr:hypothetical protein [Gammaproteobacteria bacterium]OUV67535.1 MAG: hypothetical protein CBC93_04480 [Gammaproteobacteria bacterium TMED133]
MNYKYLLFVVFLLPICLAYIYLSDSFEGDNRMISLKKDLNDKQLEQIFDQLKSVADLNNLLDIKIRLEEISSVHSVYVARKWPNNLELDIRLEKAIAYWNDDAYINDRGEVFIADYLVGGDLPQLYGPKGSAPRVMEVYQQFNRVLFKSGNVMKLLKLNDRGAWEFHDSSGTKIFLGNEDIRERLQRTVDILYEIENESLGTPKLIDARYNNGVAVEWNNKLEIAKNSKLQRDVSL